MDPRFLKFYNSELQFIREMGAEFAREFPKIAGRLDLESFDCADPYVERLLEGFAFLAARIQLKLDAQFPVFTQHLLEMVYPHYLTPTPSMAVVQLQPDLTAGELAQGYVVPRGSRLRSRFDKGEQTSCEFSTAHDVTLWPLEIAQAEYFPTSVGLPQISHQNTASPKAGFRLRLRTTAGLTFDQLMLQNLPLFLRGSEAVPMLVYQQLMANKVAMVVRSVSGSWQEEIDSRHIRRMGFESQEALLPYGARSFSGYRLLHEYFAFPERYLFVELGELGSAFRQCGQREVDIFILLDSSMPALEGIVSASTFTLFCSPAINLFAKRCDRIHLNRREHEYHVVVDRTRPMDFEIYDITDVTAHGVGTRQKQPFLPFYTTRNSGSPGSPSGYYTLSRQARKLSEQQRQYRTRSDYIGSEVFVSLVDAAQAPYSSELRQLSVNTWCTNRDLPLYMPVGGGITDFTMESGAPVNAIRCLAGPSKPKASYLEGDTVWRLISHLSLNYLSIAESDEQNGAAILRELLGLYSFVSETSTMKQLEGIQSVAAEPVVRRMPVDGPIAFGRGLEVCLTLEEAAFEGSGCFLLGAVLDEFFSKFVSINSFTETVIKTDKQGEIMRWPVRAGLRQQL